jgi:electron-transferring-flavoprotein dehydrogenase
MPRLAGDGWMLLGDSASFLNSQRLKGIHLAIKSGMLAAETAYDAMVRQTYTASQLADYKRRVDESWIREELHPVRNFHQAFEHGLIDGFAKAGIQQLLKGANLGPDFTNRPGYEHLQPLDNLGEHPHGREAFLGNAAGDPTLDPALTFDRLTDVYHSGTRHEDDQPTHLVIADLDICNTRCTREFGNPCQYFCPAAVYEMVEETAEAALEGAVHRPEKRLQINFANCVHCKTCDIADPYQIITWVPPEGGGGPNYDGM